MALAAKLDPAFGKARVTPNPAPSLPRRRFADDPGATVVRAPFGRGASPAPRAKASPELGAALETVMRAADLIASAQERADHAEQTRFQIGEHVEFLRTQLQAAEDRLVLLSDEAERDQASAEAEMERLRAYGASEGRRADEAEARLKQVSDQCDARLKDAHDRVFAAETRALEAKEDIAYLETQIRERLGV